MTLHDLLHAAGLTPTALRPAALRPADGAIEIVAVHADSRRVVPGTLFVACDGLRSRGSDFVPAAIAAGAVAVVVAHEASVIAEAVVVVRVSSPRAVLGDLVSASYGHPSRAMEVVAITGTNGKTTTATLVAQLLSHSGRRAAALGTLGLWTTEGIEPGGLTTPDPVDLQGRLAALRDRGFDTVILEASSHALDQRRLAGTQITIAAWSNLSRDHLDYHGDLATYAAAKSRLFTDLLTAGGTAWVNGDDAAAVKMHGRPGVRAYSFGAAPQAEAQVAGLQLNCRGISLFLHLRDETEPVHLRAPLLGRHNAHNLVLAALLCRNLGLSAQEIEAAAQRLVTPRGRLEPVPNRLGALILVDYAHTPSALQQVLAVGRELLASNGRLHVVFGCGGDRDAGKRAPMGMAAGGLADVSIATSDNPRSEDPDAILHAVAEGLQSAGARLVTRLLPSTRPQFVGDRICLIDADRDAAIRRAIGLLEAGDVLIIAGKGHEITQTIGTTARPFDDVAVAKRWLSQRKVRPTSGVDAGATQRQDSFHFDAATAAAATGGSVLPTSSSACTTVLTTDSRNVPPGALFVALVGDKFDGHAYLHAALDAGASGLLCLAGRADDALVSRLRRQNSNHQQASHQQASHRQASHQQANHQQAWLCTVPDTLIGLADLALAHRRRFTGQVICITGSNGKTSTKELTALALGAAGPVLATYKNHNNRIGVPQTLARIRSTHRYAVVECGMSVPGEIAELGRMSEPDVAVLTNISAAHLEGLGTVEGVAAEKADLLRSLGRSAVRGVAPGVAPGVAIVPAHEPLLEPHLRDLSCRIIRVAEINADGRVLTDSHTFADSRINADVYVVGEVQVVGLSQHFSAHVCGVEVAVQLPAIGLHMVQNALTALAIAHAVGVNLTAAAWALARFEPVGQRMRPLQLPGMLVLEDCYNANPASVAVALQTLASLPGPQLAVLGDMLELGARSAELHEAAGAAAAAAGVHALIARGRFAAHTIRGAQKAGLAASEAFETDAEGAVLIRTNTAKTVLIKGSRGARMEGIIAALRTDSAAPRSNPPRDQPLSPATTTATSDQESDHVSVAV